MIARDRGLLDLPAALAAVAAARPRRARGRLVEVCGLVARAVAPGARVGDVVLLRPDGGGAPVAAEVVGFRGDEASLLPLGEARGLGPRAACEPLGGPLTVRCGDALLGRVLDALGRPSDGGPPLPRAGLEERPVDAPAPDPLRRQRIDRPMHTGVRVIDGLLTLGEGQRIGLFSGSGVGKSTLLGQLARQCDADVSVVALVGERGREVREFLEDALGPAGRARSVVVCATSDAPPLARLRAASTATAIAEHFRDRGRRVLLLVDSVTRLARARREVGLAAGEPPARQGYPPSVFAELPRLLERAGPGERGSITAIYAVLVAGSDLEEPIADEVRGILDGHVVLDRALAARGRRPAVDVVASLSRLADRLVDEPHRAAAARVRTLLAAYEERRDLIVLGAYARGADPTTDEALARLPQLEAFLRQRPDEATPAVETRARLAALAAG